MPGLVRGSTGGFVFGRVLGETMPAPELPGPSTSYIGVLGPHEPSLGLGLEGHQQLASSDQRVKAFPPAPKLCPSQTSALETSANGSDHSGMVGERRISPGKM